jgi:tetratricopeptide (TPR) repeat protein
MPSPKQHPSRAPATERRPVAARSAGAAVTAPGPGVDVCGRSARARADVWAAAALAAVTFVAFAPALRCDFVNFDDPYYVIRNPRVTGGLSPGAAVWAFTTFDLANWHPLSWLSLQLDATLWGKDPLGYHLTNVLLHAANAALLFLALRALTGAFGASAAAALLFAVHPLRVESVAWVTERKDVLCAFFGLLALWGYAGYARRPGPARYLAVAVPFTFGLLAKPMLVTLPFLLLVLDWWPLGRWRTRGAWPLVLEKVPLFALSLASAVITFEAQASQGAVVGSQVVAPGARAGGALVAYGTYLAKTAWPVGLAVLYPDPGPSGPGTAGVLASALVVVAVSAAAVALRKRAPYLLAGWLWFLGMLVPVLGLVRVGNQAYADRYTYLPQVGALVALCWGASDAARSRPRLKPVLVAVAALLLSAVTWNQLGYWTDSVTLWRHNLVATDPCPVALVNCADALLVRGGKGDRDEAESCLRQATGLDPSNVEACSNLGLLLQDHGKYAEAERLLRTYCELRPAAPEPYTSLADVLYREKKLDEAADNYERALRVAGERGAAPWRAGVYIGGRRIAYDRSSTLCNLAMVEMARDRLDRAGRCYREASQLRPDLSEAHNGLGCVLIRQGKAEEGIAELREAIRLSPGAGQAHNNLAKALEDRGDLAGAAEHYAEAALLNPELGLVWYNLARVRDRQGRSAEAAECLVEAAKRDPRAAEPRRALLGLLDRLAAAGRTDEAAAAARRARDRAGDVGLPDLARQIETRLAGNP